MNRRNTIMITALREMCAGKKITALDYAKRFDTTRLGARIYDLRQLASENMIDCSGFNPKGVKTGTGRVTSHTSLTIFGATKGANS